MANFVPALFGKPSFGSQERDAWLEALMLFLADPFRPIGGRFSIEVPGSAITGQVPGSAIWRDNSYGIRELNEFSDFDTVADTATMGVSNRPGFLFVFNATDVVPALYVMSGTTFVNSTASLVYGSASYFATAGSGGPGTAGRLTLYHDGTGSWLVEKQLGHSVDLYMCVVSLGDQVTS